MESWCCTWRRFIVGNDIISLSADLSRRIHLARNRRTKAYQLCRILFPSRRYIRAAIVVVVVVVDVVPQSLIPLSLSPRHLVLLPSPRFFLSVRPSRSSLSILLSTPTPIHSFYFPLRILEFPTTDESISPTLGHLYKPPPIFHGVSNLIDPTPKRSFLEEFQIKAPFRSYLPSLSLCFERNPRGG